MARELAATSSDIVSAVGRADVSALCLASLWGGQLLKVLRQLGQTRAVKTIQRIIRRHGGDHARWVLRTLAETSNNKMLIDETGLWATSDLIRAYGDELQADPEAWFQVWDTVPVGRRQWEVQQG